MGALTVGDPGGAVPESGPASWMPKPLMHPLPSCELDNLT
jgi:hypothetical protein